VIGVEILLATGNAHKVEEVRGILAPAGVRVLCLADVPGAGDLEEPVEDADTFEGNARIKAVYYAKQTGRACIADDSGLEVDALGGEPGVLSARYAGVDGARAVKDKANNAKLLRALAGVAEGERRARFVCAMCAVDAAGNVLAQTRGHFDGVIGFEEKGTGGFGYDPLLVLADGRTSAELSAAEKNGRSHRGAAAREMAGILQGLVAKEAE
jgi:XTP/dITP diphosphohydrolase